MSDLTEITEAEETPRFMRFGVALRGYVEQLTADTENPDRYSALVQVASELSDLALNYDFATSHPDLAQTDAGMRLGAELQEASKAADLPAGFRDILRDFYGAELPNDGNLGTTEST